ncbi:MAPEG family protein [Microbulbifer sp. 2201CG32-9]|uniref:MAPEG family protein n=1 Tax=Microbulbifer sp. 2201CG32-9 TaxID=3232309 RepID=UPI00345C1A7D
MDIENQILGPVIGLAAWSMIMWIWMYVTRIPAIQAAKMKMDPCAPQGVQMASLPARVRWKADNYNHLMEQPTVFYALAVSLALLGEGSGLNLYLAWGYVGLRVIHSLIQALTNKIELRFLVFVLSNIPLFWLTLNAIMIVV